MIFKIVESLCKEKGISIAKLEKECGFGNCTIRSWKVSSPSVDKLKVVADYFAVPIDYFLDDKASAQQTG